MSVADLVARVGGSPVLSASQRLWATLGLVAVAMIAAALISPVLFVAAAAIGVAVFAVVALRSPRGVLVLLAFAPLLDRYVIQVFLPREVQPTANLVSEGLLVVAAGAITLLAWRSHRLVGAIRHPVSAFAIAFVLVALLSALVNGVSRAPALLGIIVTVDGVVLFVLARALSFDERTARAAVMLFIGIATAAACLALGQVMLAPDILGLAVFAGRFGEGARPGAIFIAQPNLLGAVLAMAVPFVAMAASERGISRRTQWTWWAVIFVLVVAIVFTFSRGSWAALVAAMVVIGIVVDRRALASFFVVGVFAVAAALALPRGLLLADGSQWSIDLGNATFGRLGTLSNGEDLRLKFIENALPIVRDHPVIGTGPGTYGGGIAARYGSSLYESYTAGVVPVGRTVDNYWLHALVEFGPLGVALLAGALGFVVLELLRAARRLRGTSRLIAAGAAGMAMVLGLASGLEMLLEGNTTSFPLWFFLGVATLLVRQSTQPGIPESAGLSPPPG